MKGEFKSGLTAMQANWTAQYIETVKYLERLYDYCNDKFFNNELTKPVI